MGSRRYELDVSLPRGWTKHVKSAVLHAIALATTALMVARGHASRSRSSRQCLAAELDRANTEVALLKEELAIKDARWSRLPSRRRPYYTSPIRTLFIKLARESLSWAGPRSLQVIESHGITHIGEPEQSRRPPARSIRMHSSRCRDALSIG